ncbi:DNA-binding protein [Acidovorax sp. A1169]|uniref:DNA-binding protein n=1 Tax=Acidovorax sp. A1169 TaxID=3059524 RepID=UPI002737E8E2|nr:DNA-binding protein [Acidovorax sp. A1169]MDP4077039.1 DNA-binding protein [Acidovorax sp. A1169]
MFTVVETPTFQRQVADVWTEADRLGFIAFIATNPEAGEVIPGAEGARKVRWTVAGRGKRGGARVIYFNLSTDEIVLLVAVYTKSEKDNFLPKEIKR